MKRVNAHRPSSTLHTRPGRHCAAINVRRASFVHLTSFFLDRHHHSRLTQNCCTYIIRPSRSTQEGTQDGAPVKSSMVALIFVTSTGHAGRGFPQIPPRSCNFSKKTALVGFPASI
jgi:hypothetical protein